MTPCAGEPWLARDEREQKRERHLVIGGAN
jgi:hypothetical protein